MGIAEKLACFVANLVTAIVMVVATSLYFTGVPLLRDIPLIGHVPLIGWIAEGEISRRTDLALAAQVTLYEKTADEAKAGEVQRQTDAVNASVAAYQRRLAESQAAETQAETDREQGIADYEKRLADLKRQCFADDADVDFLLRNH